MIPMLSKENLALYAFQKFGDTALQAAFCCIGNRADAEDVAQEVFFSLHKTPRDFADDEPELRALCDVYIRSFAELLRDGREESV